MKNLAISESERLSDIIALIYDSAHHPELWPKLLTELDELTDEDQETEDAGNSSVASENSVYTKLLQPHFQRALQINKKIYSLQTERDAVSDILDRLPIGVILVDADKTPRAMNKHARILIETGKCLAVHQGKLIASTQANTLKLHKLIHKAMVEIDDEDNLDAGESLLLAHKTDGVCSLHIIPSAHMNIITEQTLVAIFIASSDIKQKISDEALINMYALTHSEAKLLNTMLNGSNSLTEAADELKVSKHTVRTQIKSILVKTNTHSQTELIKKVLSSPAALIGEKQSAVPITDIKALESGEGNMPAMIDAFKTITLFDGRKLEYTEYGDPNGTPVLFFHSCVHSRHALHPYSQYIEEHNIRVIAPERPGFGESDLLPKSNDSRIYTEDIRQLMQELAIEQFSILADTSGAWAGFACACFLKERVKRLAVVTVYPEPRFDFPKKVIMAERLMMKTYQTLHSIFLPHIAKIVLRGLSRKPEKYFERMLNELCGADQKIVTTPEHQSIMAEALRNAYPDRIKGYTDDFMQRAYAWDFDITECQVETQIWHGTANTIVAFDTAEKIAASLPKAKLFPVQEGGHYIIISHWDAIMHELVV